MAFQIGDTVELKSGSPTMTIARLGKGNLTDSGEGAWCDWFADGKREHQWFPLTSLKKEQV
jgi:uncharacterized protein YodC (DUF2158 family)